MFIKKTSRNNGSNRITHEQIKDLINDVKENSKISLGCSLIKEFHQEIINMDDNSFFEQLDFEYIFKSTDEIFCQDFNEETGDNLGYYLWVKLKESNITSLESIGISDSTLQSLLQNKMPIWDLKVLEIQGIINSLKIDAKKFLKVISNFDLTLLNMSFNTSLFARLDSGCEVKEKADLIGDAGYDLFIAQQDKKRTRFLKEMFNLLY